jgi:creatinine amidohydrolase
MPIRRLAELSWTAVRDLDPARLVAILPVGAIEAHGPHLPLSTDVIIAEAMAEAGALQLQRSGVETVVLPPLAYTSAGFARAFPGTVSCDEEAVERLLFEIARSLAAQGFRALALANAHLDPGHLRSLYGAAEAADNALSELPVVFPDITRRPWGARLTEEFRSGACHAGRYEGSIVLARRPDLVDDEAAAKLPENPASLSVAIRDGLDSFEAAGGPEAYFGDPAAASAEEGERTIAILGAILAECVRDRLAGGDD